MKIRSSIVALAVAGLTLTACTNDADEQQAPGSPSADATGTMTVWLMDGSQPQSVIDAVNDEFAKAYPDVTVAVELQQWGGIQDKLITALGTDGTPDVVEIGNSLTARYAAAELLADLSAYADEFKVDQMLPGLQPPGEYNGIRYGIPYYGGVRVVVYNSRQFEEAGIEEPPTSLKQLSAAAAALRKANSKNDEYSAFYFPGKYWYGGIPFVWDAGGRIAQQDGAIWTGTLDQPEAVAGLTRLKKLVDKYSQAPVEDDDTKNMDAFRTGNVGMMIDSWWVPGALNTGDLQGDIGAFVLPGSAPDSSAPVFFGGSDLAVPAKSDQQGLAVQWVKILTGLQLQTQLAEEAGVIPNQEGAFEGHRGNPFLLVADEAATNSRFTPVSPNWVDVEASQVLPQMLVDILSGEQTVQEATASASAQITDLLNG